MIPELGHFALILALALAVALAALPMAGVFTGREMWMRAGGSLAAGLFTFMLLAYACLAWSFLQDDFSVAYVAQNSNSMLPPIYKFSAAWGAHEGSFLLWTLIMSGWTLAVAIFSRSLPLDILARVLSVMGLLTIGFILFLLMTSNPFERLLPVAAREGADLNPQLQDFGLIVHPPMLYTGYVGFSVAFAFAIAALWSGRLDAAWARWSRPWTNIAWGFLTVGIALGSWWAYYELGWGGWWFWDAVENASFMPWLVGTALIHSLAVTEKRGVFKSWTVLLAIAAFSLSLLGAFIVRSGVLTSVHAFAVDPERGMFILIFLLMVVGGSLTLYAVRAPVIRADARYAGLSREVLLLVNNVLLVVSTAAVLLGTLYPLIYEALTDGDKISVGPPYFNAVFVPLMLLLLLAMAPGPLARWKRTGLAELVRKLSGVAVVSVVLGVLLPLVFAGALSLWPTIAISLAIWVLGALVVDTAARVANKGSLGARLRAIPKLGAGYIGMCVAHLGIAVSVIGIALTITYSDERDVRLEPGQSVELGDWRFRFDGVRDARGPNYVAQEGTITVFDGDEQVEVLHPQKRRYLARQMVMTEAAIEPGLFRDLYVALGEPLGETAWAVRVHSKPFVRWVWLGGVLMALGGLLAAGDKRYRKLAARDAARAGRADGARPAAQKKGPARGAEGATA
ncbi:MAG TPA: heme lyase CcmF/NrfE family subunit [Pseudomonadales bacterium]|nr:heme lyase CcmF/NrfE family subunit [Pseudomonadales bacterium]